MPRFAGPCKCRCGPACEETSYLCVSYTRACDLSESAGIVITATGPGGTYSWTTGFGGTRSCYSPVVPGTYEITASKPGCTFSPGGTTTVACGGTGTVPLGVINCSEGSTFQFTIKGCGGNPLSGAVCTLGGANSGTATTDGDGFCEIPVGSTGVTTWTVTHPSGRFATASGSKTIYSVCSESAVTVDMSAAEGYACCFPGVDNPYPISTSLVWTDCTGEYSFEIDPVGCGQDKCVEISLDDASLAGPTTCTTCTGGGTKVFPPTDIGTNPINVLLSLTLGSGSTNILRYFYRTFTSVGVKFLNYKSGAACPDCGADDSSRSWRMSATCDDLFSSIGTGGVNWETRASISYVINSVVPFNLTATINTAGNGYGPGAPYTSWSGSAPCATVVISEAV